MHIKVLVKKIFFRPVPDSVHDKEKIPAAVNDASSSEKSVDNPVSPKNRGVSSIELSPPRPNIKQGNLADKTKTRYPPQKGPRKDGPREPGRERNFDNRNPPQRREGGFTGAQAREGYQNRSDRGASGGYQGDQNRTSGGYQGNSGYQGGQNRGSGGYRAAIRADKIEVRVVTRAAIRALKQGSRWLRRQGGQNRVQCSRRVSGRTK